MNRQTQTIRSLFVLGATTRRIFAERMKHETWAADAGLRPGCYGVLAAIGRSRRPVSQRQVSEIISIDPSDLVAVIDALEGGGYVERHRDPDDRRRYALVLTESGETALGRFNAIAADVHQEVFAALDQAEQIELDRLLALAVDAPAEVPAPAR